MAQKGRRCSHQRANDLHYTCLERSVVSRKVFLLPRLHGHFRHAAATPLHRTGACRGPVKSSMPSSPGRTSSTDCLKTSSLVNFSVLPPFSSAQLKMRSAKPPLFARSMSGQTTESFWTRRNYRMRDFTAAFLTESFALLLSLFARFCLGARGAVLAGTRADSNLSASACLERGIVTRVPSRAPSMSSLNPKSTVLALGAL